MLLVFMFCVGVALQASVLLMQMQVIGLQVR
jgi:hypothetical protein